MTVLVEIVLRNSLRRGSETETGTAKKSNLQTKPNRRAGTIDLMIGIYMLTNKASMLNCNANNFPLSH